MAEYTWADLEAAVGRDFSGGEERTGIDPVEWSGIRRYCEPIELGCPIHYDEAVARAAGYRGVVLPVSATTTFTSGGVWKPGSPSKWTIKDAHALFTPDPSPAAPELPAPRTTAGFVTDIEIEYFEPVVVGDRLTSKGRKLLSVNVRETSVGFGAFMIMEGYIYNQRGQLVAVTRNGSYRYNPHPPEKLAELRAQQRANAPARSEAGGSASAAAGPDYTELAKTKQPRSDWREQLYWEDVREGDEVPPVPFIISVQRLVIEAGANRDFNPIHHDTVLTQRTGVQEMYANNGFIQGMWERCIREYIGIHGKIKKVGPYRIRNFNEAGMTATTLGRVVRKYQEDGKNLVELEVWTENDRNGRTVSVGPGPVIVELPSRPRRSE